MTISPILYSSFTLLVILHQCCSLNDSTTSSEQNENPENEGEVQNKKYNRVHPRLVKATAKHTASVIFLHGMGDTGHDWVDELREVCGPNVKIICPTANVMPISYRHGRRMTAWFEKNDDVEGIHNSTTYIFYLINKEIRYGIPPEKIILIGFAQGGALALHTAMSFRLKLGGIVALSAWLPMQKNYPQNFKSSNKDIQILQCHGDVDPVISHAFGYLAFRTLQQLSKNADFKTYYGLRHKTCKEEWTDVKKFLDKIIGSTENDKNSTQAEGSG